MVDASTFNLQPNFPIAGVADLYANRPYKEALMRSQQQHELVEGMKTFGAGVDSLVNRRLAMAQALTMGQSLGMQPNEVQGLMPEQVEKIGQIKQGQIQMGALMMGLHPELSKDPTFMARFGMSAPQAAQPAPQDNQNGGGAILTGGFPATPNASAPAPSTPDQAQPPAPVPMPIPPLNKATGNALLRIGLATRNTPVLTPSEALNAGSIPKDARIVDPSKQGSGVNNEYDRLENQVINRIVGIRGDKSLARVEEQRDAATQAYNTIANIKQENRAPNQIEYYDILGQMWKARTGASPDQQAIRDLDAKTFKGDLGKAYQYFSGSPAPRTTVDVMNAIQKFAEQSGNQADKLHDGYMQAHLVKPRNMSQEDFNNIVKAHRGLTFNEATQEARQATSTSGDIHDQALQWANAHPDDPRAKDIIQKATSAKGQTIGL